MSATGHVKNGVGAPCKESPGFVVFLSQLCLLRLVPVPGDSLQGGKSTHLLPPAVLQSV